MIPLWEPLVGAARPVPMASIGECMIEIARAPDGATRFGYAGDTLNTAIYMARLGLAPAYVTALGADPYSDGMIAFWTGEGIDASLVVRRPDKLPGLYIIATDGAGERSFHYWRSDAAVRTLFTDVGDDAVLATLGRYAVVYWSGITLAVLKPEARERLLAALTKVRAGGKCVAFDANYRPRLWHNRTEARAAYKMALAHADLVFTSLDDEGTIFGGNESTLFARHIQAGVRETVLRESLGGGRFGSRIVVAEERMDKSVEAPAAGAVVDTTAAGDSYAAAYIAARLKGADAISAALAGHRLAGAVCSARGAILPREAMPALD